MASQADKEREEMMLRRAKQKEEEKRRRKEAKRKRQLELDILALQRQEYLSQRDLRRTLQAQRQTEDIDDMQRIQSDWDDNDDGEDFRPIRDMRPTYNGASNILSTLSDPQQIRNKGTKKDKTIQSVSLSQWRLEARGAEKPLPPFIGQDNRVKDGTFAHTNMDPVGMEIDESSHYSKCQ